MAFTDFPKIFDTDLNIDTNFSDVNKVDDVVQYSQHFNTLILEETTLSVLQDLDNFESCIKKIAQFECLDIDSLGESKNFNTSKAIFSLSLEKGLCTQEFLNTRLLQLFRITKSIIVVDRYLLKNDIFEPKSSRALINFFSFLRRQKIFIKDITIISSDIGFTGTVPRDILVENFIRKEIKDYNCKRLKILIKEDSYFKSEAHDRYVLTDDYIISIGTGLGEVIGHKIIQRTTDFKCCFRQNNSVGVGLVRAANTINRDKEKMIVLENT